MSTIAYTEMREELGELFCRQLFKDLVKLNWNEE